MNWHLLDIPTILAAQECNPDSGLTSENAAKRLESGGPNELLDRGGKSPWLILWEQFTSTMALILSGAALVSGFVGSLKDCLTIMAIVCLFALLGFFQEFRAERTMRALKKLAIPFVRVRRDGATVDIPSVDLVPGDIVLLEAGNLVPADCRILESYNLKIQESILTGEADAVEKITDVLAENSGSIGDLRNMAFMGTTVAYGRGVVIVVATGMQTELGKIATMLQDVVEEMTPLQKRLDRLGKVLAVIAILISILYFMLGLMRGEELRLLLMTAVSLAVAAIPEGLPAVVTITLAIGSQRMLQRRALIRKLPAVETLGSVTVICSDKTGTLTENSMTVTDLRPAAENDDKLLLLAAVLCNDAVLRLDDGTVVMLGDPTETALLVAAGKSDLYKPDLEVLFPRIAEVPFDSATKRMVTMHTVSAAGAADTLASAYGLHPGDRFIIAKGAVDVLLSYCDDIASVPGILANAEELALQGKRVLACVWSRLEADQPVDQELIHDRMKFTGLIAMMDPPRSEARAAVIKCLQAGIRPVMITGDHPLTASSIARSLEITDNNIVVTGSELDRIGPDGLAGMAGHVSVYARVSPAHKLLIVEALQMRGDVVAMTGDGVNDAPALKKADIGVSMGITGTDVAKEAADMVLLDDNFATIVSAVEEGRTIYDNIRKFIEFSVAGNLGKIIAVMALPIMGLANPLTPLQLLWLNLLTDGLLGLGMGVERPEPDIMRRAPISTTSQIIDRRMLRHILLTGGVIGLSSIAVARHHWLHHPSDWQTALFTSLAFAQIGQAMALRSLNHSFFKVGYFSNPLLLGMCIAVILLQVLVVFLPSMQSFFNTTTIELSSLIWIISPGVLVFATLEVEKALSKSKPAQQL
ncbi:MAG: ATPase [Geobacteraceae bacterium GWC2_55_20]|nr:MAG: ATPase [Geobacteraceae bacterium GWC2_55_20]HBA73348.1 ATPase [Geobacter sp.]HCE67494.1 ATPase [Geobacter sp.]